MLETSPSTHLVFTATFVYSLAGVAAVLVLAFTAERVLFTSHKIPHLSIFLMHMHRTKKKVLWTDLRRADPFHFGRLLHRPVHLWAYCEYAAVDPTIVSIGLVTVFGAGTLTVWIVYQIVRHNPAILLDRRARHS